jgi:hypothetical protein
MCDYYCPGTGTARSAQSARQPSDDDGRSPPQIIIPPAHEQENPPSSLCLTKVPTSLLPAISRVRMRRKDPGIVRQSAKGKFLNHLTFSYQRLLLLADTDKEPAEGKGFPRRWKPYLLV